MFESSIFIHWLSGLFRIIGDIWRESYACKLCKRVAAWFSKLTRDSAIFRFIGKDGYLVRIWEGSAASKVFDWLVNLIPSLLNMLYTRFQAVFDKSLIFRFIRFLARNVSLLTAVFLAVALVIPSSRWHNEYATIAIVGLFCLFLIDTMSDKKVRVATKVVDIFMFIFLVAIVLAQVFSVYPSLSLRFLIMYFTDFMLMLLLVSSIKTREQLANVIEIILAGVTICGLFGLYQAIVGVPVNLSQVDINTNEGMPGRIYSTIGNSNDFAEIIVMLIPLFAAVIINSKGWQKRLLFVVAAAPLFLSLLASYSRSGWIGFIIAALVFVFLIKRSLIPVFIVIGLVAFPFLPETITNRIATITNLQDTSTSTRFDIWKTIWPQLKDFWYTGVGLGSDAVSKITSNYFIYTKKIPLHAHNIYLQIWLETGIIGLISFLGSMIRIVKKSIRSIFDRNAEPYCRNVLIAGVSGLIGVLVIALVEYIWYYPRVMMVFWLLLGLIFAALKLSRERDPAQKINME